MKRVITALMLSAGIATGHAQEALGFIMPERSPEVNPDSTVTFRLRAPEARSVGVTGIGMQPLPMEKDSPGLWSVTTRLRPDLYTYAMLVDGMRIIDPSNVYVARDIASLSNVLIVPGGNAAYYA
ncbi:MAG: esterase, partial [Muribaculaceae bacterium]|nr:esterase [Muribaculaceae bacterium]